MYSAHASLILPVLENFASSAWRSARSERARITARTATRFVTPDDNALPKEMVRPEMRATVRLRKPASGFPARAHDENCDGELMPVICPTAQELFSMAVAEAFSVKPLHRRRGFSGGNRLGRLDGRRRTYLGRRLLLRYWSSLRFATNPRARCRPPTSP